MIENEANELTLIYHSEKAEDRKTRAYIETLSEYAIKTLDLKKDSLTETQLAEIADKMDSGISDLIDASYADKLDAGTLSAMSRSGQLTLLKRNPMLLNTPILIIGKKAYKYSASFEVLEQNSSTDGVGSIPAANVEERRSK